MLMLTPMSNKKLQFLLSIEFLLQDDRIMMQMSEKTSFIVVKKLEMQFTIKSKLS
ncbi:hypothetical protein GCM10022397_19120 [Flavivirga jejuensis]